MSYASTSKMVTAATSIVVLPVRDCILKGASIAAGGAATGTIEVFDGIVGIVDATGDVSVSAGGTKYEVGDVIRITPTNGGTYADFTVATIGGAGAITGVTLLSAGNGFLSGGTYAATLISTNGGELAGALLTAAINAAGTGYTANDVLTLSTEVGGTAATVKVDTVGALGIITGISILTKGKGYVQGSTYTVTGGTGNNDATIDASTVAGDGSGATLDTDTVDNTQADAVIKLSAVANTTQSVLPCVFTRKGISAFVTGANAEGFLYYE